MGQTIIEKILSNHSGHKVKPGDITEVTIDCRAARDFGGANVVKNIETHKLGIQDPSRTFFTFDCYPGATDAKYATNQQICRIFAKEQGIAVSDVDQGIGTHVAIDQGLVGPGETFVSTDSHANIIGAIGAFGQGMGDQDIAHAFAHGFVWFKVPLSMKVVLKGKPNPGTSAKDVSLKLLQTFGANGLLGYAAEIYGDYIDQLPLAGRVTISSQATEMGGIIAIIPPNNNVIAYCERATGREVKPVYADDDAEYDKVVEIDISNLGAMMSRPGHPEDVVAVSDVAGNEVHSGFIGSCTNGRFEDMAAAAEVLKDRHIAHGLVLKIVPSTDEVWRRCLDDGIIATFKNAGALVSNSGCAGCAAGQVGQNGPGEVTISTGNRNYVGKQGKGDVYLASPAIVAACAVAGKICLPSDLPAVSGEVTHPKATVPSTPATAAKGGGDDGAIAGDKTTTLEGRVWVVREDNIDTDMIFHNRYLAITELAEMGPYTFDNLAGWEDFSKRAKPGDIVITGKNFGAGSSRQQAVDCFKALGVTMIIAESFGAIYERNAINAGLPILSTNLLDTDIKDGEKIKVDLATGEITRQATGETITGGTFSEAQMRIYQRGGLLT